MSLRLARPEDEAAMRRFNEEQNREQGTSTALPQLFTGDGLAPNIALAFIVERDGVPVQGFFYELVPEMCFAGCDPKATAFARRQIVPIAFLLRCMGLMGINCKVPNHMAEVISDPLEKAGFAKDESLTNFFKDLRLPAMAEEETS